MHPPLALDVVGEAEDAAVSPPTLTLLARVERLEEQICRFSFLQEKQLLSPGAEHRSSGSSEPSTPSSFERRRKSAMEVLGDTVAKGTVLERVTNLEQMQAAISRTASPNGRSPSKVTRSLCSSSPRSEPRLESFVSKISKASAELPEEDAPDFKTREAENGHFAAHANPWPEESVHAASEQAAGTEAGEVETSARQQQPEGTEGGWSDLLKKQPEDTELAMGGSNLLTKELQDSVQLRGSESDPFTKQISENSEQDGSAVLTKRPPGDTELGVSDHFSTKQPKGSELGGSDHLSTQQPVQASDSEYLQLSGRNLTKQPHDREEEESVVRMKGPGDSERGVPDTLTKQPESSTEQLVGSHHLITQRWEDSDSEVSDINLTKQPEGSEPEGSVVSTKLPQDSEPGVSDVLTNQLGGSEVQGLDRVTTQQPEDSERGGSDTATEAVALTRREEEEAPQASISTVETGPTSLTEEVVNPNKESRSPPRLEQDKKLPLQEMQNNRTFPSEKEIKEGKSKPWKRLRNYLKKKMHSMSSSRQGSRN